MARAVKAEPVRGMSCLSRMEPKEQKRGTHDICHAQITSIFTSHLPSNAAILSLQSNARFNLTRNGHISLFPCPREGGGPSQDSVAHLHIP